MCPAELLPFICDQSHIRARFHPVFCKAYGLYYFLLSTNIYDNYFNKSNQSIHLLLLATSQKCETYLTPASLEPESPDYWLVLPEYVHVLIQSSGLISTHIYLFTYTPYFGEILWSYSIGPVHFVVRDIR